MVQIHPDPPSPEAARRGWLAQILGAIAQLGERLLCKQEVIGSIPIGSTSFPRSNAAACNFQLPVLRPPPRVRCCLTIRKFFSFDAHVQAIVLFLLGDVAFAI